MHENFGCLDQNSNETFETKCLSIFSSEMECHLFMRKIITLAKFSS